MTDTSGASDLHEAPRAGVAAQAGMIYHAIFASPVGRRLIVLLTALIVAILATTYGQIVLNRWNQPFYDAITRRDLNGFLTQLGVYFAIVGSLLVLDVAQLWLNETTKYRLREGLTRDLLNLWLAPRRAFWLATSHSPMSVNPDQRMTADTTTLCDLSFDLVTGLFRSTVLLLSFAGVLWTASQGFSFRAGGVEYAVPGFMLWAAMVYAAVGSLLSYFVGRGLVRRNADHYAREADLRFALVRVSEHVDGIALAAGEADERRQLEAHLGNVMIAMRRLVRGLTNLHWVTAGFGWITGVVPILVAAPLYFTGKTTFGGMMMAAAAFTQAEGSLRWFVDNFGAIADWRATLLRVANFRAALLADESERDTGSRIEYVEGGPGEMTLEDLEVDSPVGRVGLPQRHVVIHAGEHTLIYGARGQGKTPFFRALSGLWPWGSGRIVRPDGESVMYVPQGTPYLQLGSLREALAYPLLTDRFTDSAFVQALERAGLDRCVKDLDASRRWDRELTGEEQMALVLARVELHAPHWVVFDDTFSAMENGALERAIAMFTQHGTQTTVIHIGRSTQMHLPLFKQVLHLTKLDGAEERKKKRVQLNEPTLIRSDHFAASFDTRTGTLFLRRSDGTPFVTNGAACANTDVGKQSTASPGREHSVETAPFSDRLGSGRRLSVVSRDPQKLLDLRVEIALYDRRPMVTIEAQCTNVSSRDVVVASLEPIRVLAGEGGTLRVPGVAACITNGEMYYDAGSVHVFAADPPHPTIASWWNIGLFSGYDREGVVLGYLENTKALGAVQAARTAENEISFSSESMYTPPITLRPGRSIDSNRFMLNVAASPYAALEEYADAVGAAQNARTRSVVNGWCSWFYTLAQVSEDEVSRNTEFAARHLRAFGLEYIQIDDGYQRSLGDWEGNERFPHGMKWLAERIRAHGFKGGLWIAPYVISERSDVFRLHPEWLVRRRDGSLQRIGNWEHENSPEALREGVKCYCLDITHPEAAEWLRDLFETIARRWGYEMIKIDFMAWSILAAERYRDPTLSSAEVYRRGLAIMRAAVGENCHLLECGPGNTTVGLIDSMRIEADLNYGYAGAAWKQYFQDPACSAAAAAKRYYFHRRTWVNDVDHVCLDLLTMPQAEAAATIVALSGGNMISGDRLVDLDPVKLEILKKITPSYGDAAAPVDLFDADIPTTFAWHVKRPFAAWSVVAFFNPDLGVAVERRFALSRLGLDAGKSYLVFDFWKQRLVGEVKNEVSVRVDPGSVTLLALHVATGTPQVLSTSRHVTQGAIELEAVQWSETGRTFSGISLGPPHSAHEVFVHVPGERPWAWERPPRTRDYAEYSLKLVDANVVRVHVRFENQSRVAWKIGFDDLFATP